MGTLSNQVVLQKLTARFADKISVPTEPFGLLTLETNTETIAEVLRFLKEDKELQFNYLTDITGIHYPEQELAIGVIYHLHSLTLLRCGKEPIGWSVKPLIFMECSLKDTQIYAAF